MFSTDAIEDPSLRPSTSPRTTVNLQRRRPLVQLKADDQNPEATNEEEKKRQSKKYSASFKQNQLDEILKFKSSAEEMDFTTEGKTTSDGKLFYGNVTFECQSMPIYVTLIET